MTTSGKLFDLTDLRDAVAHEIAASARAELLVNIGTMAAYGGLGEPQR
jgi:hypothetical protein